MTDREGPASTTIVRTVAEREAVAVADLRPLYDAIDPDALDQLCEHGFDGTLSFSYEGYRVIVTGDGSVSIAE